MHIHRLTLFIDRFLLVSATFPQARLWTGSITNQINQRGGDQGHFVMTSTKAWGLKTVSHISRVSIQGGWQILEGILRRAKEYSSSDEIWCLNLIWQLETVWQPRYIFSTHISLFSMMKSVFWNVLSQKKKKKYIAVFDWPFKYFIHAHIAAVSKRL